MDSNNGGNQDDNQVLPSAPNRKKHNQENRQVLRDIDNHERSTDLEPLTLFMQGWLTSGRREREVRQADRERADEEGCKQLQRPAHRTYERAEDQPQRPEEKEKEKA
jgi:hypothetical protein